MASDAILFRYTDWYSLHYSYISHNILLLMAGKMNFFSSLLIYTAYFFLNIIPALRVFDLIYSTMLPFFFIPFCTILAFLFGSRSYSSLLPFFSYIYSFILSLSSCFIVTFAEFLFLFTFFAQQVFSFHLYWFSFDFLNYIGTFLFLHVK